MHWELFKIKERARKMLFLMMLIQVEFVKCCYRSEPKHSGISGVQVLPFRLASCFVSAMLLTLLKAQWEFLNISQIILPCHTPDSLRGSCQCGSPVIYYRLRKHWSSPVWTVCTQPWEVGWTAGRMSGRTDRCYQVHYLLASQSYAVDNYEIYIIRLDLYMLSICYDPHYTSSYFTMNYMYVSMCYIVRGRVWGVLGSAQVLEQLQSFQLSLGVVKAFWNKPRFWQAVY